MLAEGDWVSALLQDMEHKWWIPFKFIICVGVHAYKGVQATNFILRYAFYCDPEEWAAALIALRLILPKTAQNQLAPESQSRMMTLERCVVFLMCYAADTSVCTPSGV